VNQAELRALAEARIQDAKALIDGGRNELGYYIAGYAVECALKSCTLARMVHTGWIYQEEVKKIDECRTHDFMKLVHIAGLIEALNTRLRESAAARDGFVENWDTVGEWSVASRYVLSQPNDAKKLYAAITDKPHGVLAWIRNY
jgi:hypothetical protein